MRHPFPGATVTRPFEGQLPRHSGVDLAYGGGTTCGRPVLAADSGIARRATNVGGGRGVVILHTPPGTEPIVETRYWHLGKQMVNDGQAVRAGDVIGLAGATGTLVTGCHLHFELNANGEYLDPTRIIEGGLGGEPVLERTDRPALREAEPGTYPDVLGSGGGRCDVAAAYRDASALETLLRPELVGWCVPQLTPTEVAAGMAGDVIGLGGDVASAAGAAVLTAALPVAANVGVIVLALILGWTGVKQVVGVR